jgi:hypothetical protein
MEEGTYVEYYAVRYAHSEAKEPSETECSGHTSNLELRFRSSPVRHPSRKGKDAEAQEELGEEDNQQEEEGAEPVLWPLGHIEELMDQRMPCHQGRDGLT